jgi:hypothetical protein
MQLERGGNSIPVSRCGHGLEAIDGWKELLHLVDQDRMLTVNETKFHR